MGQVVEAVADFLAHHIADSSHAQTAGEPRAAPGSRSRGAALRAQAAGDRRAELLAKRGELDAGGATAAPVIA